MFAKPKEGLKVFDPALRNYLPPEGREIGDLADHGYFWQRRLNEGDIEILDANAAAASLAAADAERRADQAAKDAEAAKAAEASAVADKDSANKGAAAPEPKG